MKDLKEQLASQAVIKKIQVHPGAVVQITTTITCSADHATVNVVPLKANSEVGTMHRDILLTDVTPVVSDVPVGLEIKKQVGNRFYVSEMMKAFNTFTNSAKKRVKSNAQEHPLKIRNNMINSHSSNKEIFHKRLKFFIDKEIHIKLEGDDAGVPYTLKEIEKEFLVVNYGESQRYIPINKIIFLQIGNYPKE